MASWTNAEATSSLALSHDGKRRLPVVQDAVVPVQSNEPVTEVPVEEGQEGRLFRVGDLARAAGKTVRAIHLYEELGLLRPHGRSKGRYRLFGPDALLRTRWIAKMQELGLSLNDIRTVVHEWENLPSAPGAMNRMRQVYERRLEQTRAQLQRLQALECELAATVEYLDRCDTCDPAKLISACGSCDMHRRHTDPPELVAGLSAQMKTTR